MIDKASQNCSNKSDVKLPLVRVKVIFLLLCQGNALVRAILQLAYLSSLLVCRHLYILHYLVI